MGQRDSNEGARGCFGKASRKVGAADARIDENWNGPASKEPEGQYQKLAARPDQ